MVTVKWSGRMPNFRKKYKQIQKELKKGLFDFGTMHIREREKITSNFQHKPKWVVRTNVSRTKLDFKLILVNDTAGKLWRLLNRGAKPHIIKAKKGRYLAYIQGKYNPKTFPPAGYGGPGSTNGKMVFRRQVNHPGFKARKFDDTINKKLAPKLNDILREKLERGLSK